MLEYLKGFTEQGGDLNIEYLSTFFHTYELFFPIASEIVNIIFEGEYMNGGT